MEFVPIKRSMFNETKGKDLVLKIMRNASEIIYQKYVALSCVSAINTYLDQSTGEDVSLRS